MVLCNGFRYYVLCISPPPRLQHQGLSFPRHCVRGREYIGRDVKFFNRVCHASRASVVSEKFREWRFPTRRKIAVREPMQAAGFDPLRFGIF